MNTHTRSIQRSTTTPVPATDRIPPDHDSVLEDLLDERSWSTGAHGGWPPAPTSRADLMAVVDDFAATPSGRRVLHGWVHHELLADALEVIAGDRRSDPLRLNPRDLAAAFGTSLLDDVPGRADDLAQLPELVAAFVPYAHAVRGRRSSDTAASLAVIEQCRAGFVDSLVSFGFVRGPEPWRRAADVWQPPPPSPRELLAKEVGGEEALAALGTEPLPAEPAVLADVPDDVRARLQEALDFADPVERLFDAEVRTAVRRLLIDGVTADPEVLRRKGRIETLAVGACLAVAQANHLVQPHGTMKAKVLLEHFGLIGSPTSRVSTLRRAVTGITPWSSETTLGSPRYLTAARRTEIVAARDQLRAEEEVVDQAS